MAAAGVDCIIDYRHQTLLTEKDGLYAINVRWTGRAAAHIEAEEFRYISPVFTYDTSGAPADDISAQLSHALTEGEGGKSEGKKKGNTKQKRPSRS